MELNKKGLRRDVLVIGASAGGFRPTLDLIASLPEEVPLVVAVVIHRGVAGGPSRLAEVMGRRTRRPVVEPVDSVEVTRGVVYLAPRDLHLVFEDGRVGPVRGAKEHFTRPAVDPLFISAAESFGERVLGVLLSGSGGDGVLGLIRIKARGGMSLVQSPAEAEYPSMPSTALREDHVDAALPLDELMRVVPDLARGKMVQTKTVDAPRLHLEH